MTKRQKQVTLRNTRKVTSTKAPVAVGSTLGKMSMQDIHMHHSEVIATVEYPGSGTFLLTNDVPIQPGTFPWLGPIAQRYEQYRINSLKFRYVSQTPTSDPGSVVMMFDADVKDAVAPDLTNALTNQYSVLTPVWKATELVVNDIGVLNPVNRHYIRSAVPPSPYDHKTYDTGKLTAYTLSVDSSPSFKGFIICEYDLVLYNPGILFEEGGKLAASGFTDVSGATHMQLDKNVGRLPIEIRPPNQAEIDDGAQPGYDIISIKDTGAFNLVANLVGTSITTYAMDYIAGSGVNVLDLTHASESSHEVLASLYSVGTQSLQETNWLQPTILTSALAAITSLIISMVPSNKYSGF